MLDMHCSPPQQRRMAELIEEILGRRLMRPTADRSAPTTDGVLPSPLALSGRVIVRGKLSVRCKSDAVIAAAAADAGAARAGGTSPPDLSSVDEDTPRPAPKRSFDWAKPPLERDSGWASFSARSERSLPTGTSPHGKEGSLKGP